MTECSLNLKENYYDITHGYPRYLSIIVFTVCQNYNCKLFNNYFNNYKFIYKNCQMQIIRKLCQKK